jgi:hypothetical protein
VKRNPLPLNLSLRPEPKYQNQPNLFEQEKTMAFTLNTTLGELIDNPQAKAVLDAQLPGVSTHPMVAMARGMTLNMILSMPQAAQLGLTKDKAEALLAEINKNL